MLNLPGLKLNQPPLLAKQILKVYSLISEKIRELHEFAP